MSPSRKTVPSAVVGLDIGTDSIKVAEAKHTKNGITITGLGVARTPQGAIDNEVVVDPKALGGAIKALLQESGIKTKKCVSSVSGLSQVVIRVISVPKMKPEELAETMKWEVERHVPFSPTEVVMDFQPLNRPGEDPNAQEMEVLLAVAQQQLIDNHVETLFAAGLQPMAIDIEPLASSRSLVELSQKGALDETVAIVNIGSNRTDLGVFENGILVFPSPPLSVAGISLTREISEALGQTLEQAEVTKREYAVVKLDAFPDTTVDDQLSAPDTQAQTSASEPTAFDTAFSPQSPFASAFDLDETPAQPEAEPEPDPGLAAEPANLNDFQNTVDGPVFDSPDAAMGPSFDLGGTADNQSSSGLSFDLGQDSEPVSAGPAFDLGGGDIQQNAEPASPSFDLEDDEAKPEEPAAPSFDLSDAGEEADHGQQAAPVASAPASPSGGGTTEDQVFQAIASVLVDLANELRNSLEYYSTRYGKMPERMFLCGGTAKIPKLADFLSEQLGLPVVVADPMKNLTVNVPGVSTQYLNEISPLFSVSIGLAIRDMIG